MNAMIKSVKYLFALVLILLTSCEVQAACQSTNLSRDYFTLGDIVVTRDTPVGSTIKQVNSSYNGYMIATCESGYTYMTMLYNGGQRSAYTNVYKTNVPGIGISMYTTSNYFGVMWFASPANSYYRNGGWDLYDSAPAVMSVVKIGDVTSGKLTTGLVAKTTFDYGTGYEYYLNDGTISVPSCSLQTPALTFPIGDVLASDFGNTVGVTPSKAQNTQNLGLSCDANANISVSLSGTQNPDVGTTSVLALTGQGSAGVAQGVGVQIVYNGTPLALNNPIVLKKSSGGQETLPLTARYYQTRTSVTTGTANTSATLNLTYQ